MWTHSQSNPKPKPTNPLTTSNYPRLLSRASSGSLVQTPQPERLREALTGAGVDVMLVAHDELVVGSPSDVVGRIALDAGIPVTGLKQEQQSLEDVFLELTEQAIGGRR